jgi:prevent-host-death family protein
MSEITVSDARMRLADVIDQARREPVYLTRHGKPVAVVLDAEQFERIVDELEDEEDRRAVEQAEADGEWIPWEEVMAELGLE